MKGKLCLQCKLSQNACQCENGFRVIFYFGKLVSETEAKEIGGFADNVKKAKKEIENIEKLLKEIKGE